MQRCCRPLVQVVSLLEAEAVPSEVPSDGEGDGAWSTTSVHRDERPGTITHPSCSMIAWYHPGTANSRAKLRHQPLRLESYWKRGEKYSSRMNPLSLRLLRGSMNPGSALTRILRNFFIVLLRQRRWMKSHHSVSLSPQPGAPLGSPSCLLVLHDLWVRYRGGM